jgi:hypothetical protein
MWDPPSTACRQQPLPPPRPRHHPNKLNPKTPNPQPAAPDPAPPRSVLRACLPDRGFTAHVIGFTVAAVLAALNSRCEVHGHLDSSVPLILPLIENDLFGQV